MADLRTRYLGLELRTPLVASSSPLTGTLDGLLRLEAAGAGAVVLPSLFEEDLTEETGQVDALPATGATGAEARAGHPTQAGYGAGPAAYLSLIERTKQSLSIPVIASLNGVSRGGWVRYAAHMEQAGADAVELNIYYLSSRPGRSGNEVEWHYLDVVRAVRQAIGIPLAVKLSPYFSSLANLAGQLTEAGAGGLVLFNRFYQPDLDIEAMEVAPRLELSTSVELRLPLRWIAILHRRFGVSLAASTGVHTTEDVLKVLLAGADVAMLTSALLRNGPDHLRSLEVGLRDWMDAHATTPLTSSAAGSASARCPTRRPSNGPTTSRPSPPTGRRASAADEAAHPDGVNRDERPVQRPSPGGQRGRGRAPADAADSPRRVDSPEALPRGSLSPLGSRRHRRALGLLAGSRRR
jgi:dihydroorotate dehydrogenase (fumarate)